MEHQCLTCKFNNEETHAFYGKHTRCDKQICINCMKKNNNNNLRCGQYEVKDETK